MADRAVLGSFAGGRTTTGFRFTGISSELTRLSSTNANYVEVGTKTLASQAATMLAAQALVPAGSQPRPPEISPAAPSHIDRVAKGNRGDR